MISYFIPLVISAFLLLFSSESLSCGLGKNDGFLPENDMWIPVNIKTGKGSIDEETFNKVLDRVDEIYYPIIGSLGKKFVIEREWDNGVVNAYAYREGIEWRITMTGGLARHSAVTADAFALVACHEVGHHLGGFPKKVSWDGTVSWASNEGQADYFGTAKCLRKYMEQDDNIGIMLGVHVPQIVVDKCYRNFPLRREMVMCMRGSMAGLSIANLFDSLSGDPNRARFETPDRSSVDKTYHSHPISQCRLDTYFSGSVCPVNHYANVSDDRPNQGVCSRNEGYFDGLRPLCWYKPPVVATEEGGYTGNSGDTDLDVFQAPKNRAKDLALR